VSRLETESIRLLRDALQELDERFREYPDPEMSLPDEDRLSSVLSDVAARMGDNYPYFHPLYAGQMLKPPHSIARLAYMLSLWINPNNHALDGGRASSLMEKEAVGEIARMFGWKSHLGHLCAGGTMANLEALWVAGQLGDGRTILASEQAHYTHSRISGVLRLRFESVPCDVAGRMDVEALETRLKRGDVGTVVATLGTTSTGSVDPLPAILELQKKFRFRLHADAAYGGYFVLAGNLSSPAAEAFGRLSEVDSLVIDPHKHGLQPYGCGCVLFRDPDIGRLYKHDSPYTYFSSGDLHLGEISLECSRPGAAAVALWATQRLMPLMRGGEFARGLEKGHQAAARIHEKLAGDKRFVVPSFPPELDIVVWGIRPAGNRSSSALARMVFDEAARLNLHLALAELPSKLFGDGETDLTTGQQRITCLRSVLMKPEHLDWADRIWRTLQEATDAVVGEG
jgi:glutamate/tyrosine decarboxylase-like PLP-dependent enzyme